MVRPFLAASLVLAASAWWGANLAGAPPPTAPVAFPQGVASGDVGPFSAILWTRADQQIMLTAEVATDPGFAHIVFTRNVLAALGNDFTAKVKASPLEPRRTYFYRWRAGSSVSGMGTFITAPLPSERADLRFTYSGDSDGTPVGGVPFFNNFEVLDAARSENADFFVYLGDTVYPDSSVRELAGLAPATTLDEYREVYRLNREIGALPLLLESTSTYAIWDDHEVRDNYSGQTVDPALYAIGRKAFLEYMPVREDPLPHDRDCAGDPLMRVFRWGKEAELIILDERSCRSADVSEVCQADPAPTLPAFLRVQSGLPDSPPAGCLEALFDPRRTMLGRLQKKLFEAALASSTARFEFVINELPIQQFYALPYDRWEGYAAERKEILEFIRAHHLDNVIFLSTDAHANLVNEVFIDRFTDPEPIAQEFVTGPIAGSTLQQDTLAAAGPAGLEALQGLLSLVGMECRQLDADAYGLVEVDAETHTATVALKDDMGHVLEDQLTGTSCTKTIGP
jgi:alkaline phosphatase D